MNVNFGLLYTFLFLFLFAAQTFTLHGFRGSNIHFILYFLSLLDLILIFFELKICLTH